jgi:hypothetical protein
MLPLLRTPPQMLLTGAGPAGGGALTPPTVAPVLTVEAAAGSTTANLSWTASDKTASAGFVYDVYRSIDGAGPTLIATRSAAQLTYNDSNPGAAGETYEYTITPKNDTGEGPSSNAASVVLPGESNRLLLNAGGHLELNSGGYLLING